MLAVAMIAGVAVVMMLSSSRDGLWRLAMVTTGLVVR